MHTSWSKFLEFWFQTIVNMVWYKLHVEKKNGSKKQHDILEQPLYHINKHTIKHHLERNTHHYEGRVVREGWEGALSMSLPPELMTINIWRKKIMSPCENPLWNCISGKHNVIYNQIYNWTNMSWNCTAYFLDARALLLTERVIVLCVYATHACSFNYKSDYNKTLLGSVIIRHRTIQ